MWNDVIDHRLIMLAWKAQQYDAGTRRSDVVKARVANVPKISRPGAPQYTGTSADKALRDAMTQLKKSGGKREAAFAAFKAWEQKTQRRGA